MALAIVEYMLYLVEITFRVELIVANEACGIMNHSHELWPHIVQTPIYLLPILFAHLQFHTAIIQLVRVPLSTISDVVWIDDLLTKSHCGDITIWHCRQ